MENCGNLESLCQILEKKVALIYLGSNDQKCIGHGAFINSTGLIATVAHIFLLEDKTPKKTVGDHVVVKSVHGKSFEMLEATIITLDLAHGKDLLQIMSAEEKLCFDYAKFAEDEVTIGQTIHVVATNDGKNLEYSQGNIEFDKRLYGDIMGGREYGIMSPNATLIQAGNLHLVAGFSGAPVFDLKARLVGVYCLSYGRRDFLIPLSEIKLMSAQFLEDNEDDDEEEDQVRLSASTDDEEVEED